MKKIATIRAKIVIAGTLVGLFLTFVGASSCHKSDPGSAEEVSDPASANQMIAEADKLYMQREDLAKVRQGIVQLRQARLADYGNYEAAWKLAKFNYYLGDHTTNEQERETAFREGIDAGKIAVRLQTNRPESHFWLGANYGGDAEHSTLAGLSNVEDIRNQMETVLKIDESYEAGSAYLGLGKLYRQAPRVLGGDNQKAIEYLEKGLRVGGTNPLLRLNLAEAYHAVRRDRDAEKEITFIRNMSPDPNYLPEYKEALAEANQLSEKIKSEGN